MAYTKKRVKVVIIDDEGEDPNTTENIVYKDMFHYIP
jgi:hypothetical protein